jgi:hypothetical protein
MHEIVENPILEKRRQKKKPCCKPRFKWEDNIKVVLKRMLRVHVCGYEVKLNVSREFLWRSAVG